VISFVNVAKLAHIAQKIRKINHSGTVLRHLEL